MAKSNVYSVPFRRKREGKTNYRVRMKLLSGCRPRLVIRRSLKNIWVQVVEFNERGDRVVASAHSRELAKFGWKASGSNTPAGYLVGLLLASKCKGGSCVVDLGHYLSVKGSVLYAVIKGLVDGGLKIECSESMFPDNYRICGKVIASYAGMLDSDRYNRQFGAYVKKGLDVKDLPAHFDQVKLKIGGK